MRLHCTWSWLQCSGCQCVGWWGQGVPQCNGCVDLSGVMWLCGVCCGVAGRQDWQIMQRKELVLELLPAAKAASDSASEAELLALAAWPSDAGWCCMGG